VADRLGDRAEALAFTVGSVDERLATAVRTAE
jgi:hypothetical protein